MSADILHRSMVDVAGTTGHESVYAFVAAPCPEAASRLLASVLPSLLHRPPNRVRILFTMTEQELLERSVGDAATADARLLEIGRRADGPVEYAPPERTLLLLPLSMLQRVQAAQHQARALS